ncbi:MAG TPA: Wzz/FepE/Etk N-terminal domain-containing protein [Acidimicrobiales bacterium]
MAEQAFDTRELRRRLGRHRGTVGALAVLGALVSVVLAALDPPTYSATSLVLLPDSAAAVGGSSGSPAPGNSTTDSVIATSSAVLSPALAKVDPSLSPGAARSRVRAAPTATDIVQISATGTTPGRAEALANAVAASLVSFVTSSGSATGNSAVAGLEAQATQLTKQLDDLNQEIRTNATGQDTALLASLTSAQSNASLALANVNSEIASAKLSVGATNVGTEVIQRATTASPPSLTDRALRVLIGAAIGFVAGALLVILRHKERRLVSRDQIAETVGAPVVLSLPVGRWRRSSNWLNLLRDHQPGTAERWNVRKALHHLDLPEDGPSYLTVVGVADDTASFVATTRLAIAAAELGVPTALVLTSDDEASVGVRKARDLLVGRDGTVRANLQITREGPEVRADTGLTVISIVVDPEQPDIPAEVARGPVVLAVTARFTSAEQVTRVLIAAGEGGLSMSGVVVTNPAGDDTTAGTDPSRTRRAAQVLGLRTSGELPDWLAVSHEQLP